MGEEHKELEPCPFCPTERREVHDTTGGRIGAIFHEAGCYFAPHEDDRRQILTPAGIQAWNTRPRASVAAPQGDGSGWLLEKMHNGNVHYISADYVLQWTDDPNKALRLARREDAEALCTIVEDCEKIAEHEWPSPVAPSPTPEQTHEFLQYPVGHFRNPNYDNGRCWQVVSHRYCGLPVDAEVHCAAAPPATQPAAKLAAENAAKEIEPHLDPYWFDRDRLSKIAAIIERHFPVQPVEEQKPPVVGPRSNREPHAYQEHPLYPNYCAFAVGDEDYCKRESDNVIHSVGEEGK